MPVVGYTVLQIRQNRIEAERKRIEDEGRTNWAESQNTRDKIKAVGQNLGVDVKRSGGGV